MNYNRARYIQQPLIIENELKALFTQSDKITIFEIGACEGEDTIKYARLFPFSRIYAFEALPANIQLIEKNFNQYNIRNATYYNVALSSKNGTAEFYVSSGRPENTMESDWDFGNKSSSLLPPASKSKMPNFLRFDNKIQVETITLHTFCKRNNITTIDFIHMDVQGAELMVLEGAENLISSIKAIWLEVSSASLYKYQPLVNKVKKFMRKNNFFLVKDNLDGIQGDHLYLSEKLFKENENNFPEVKQGKSFLPNKIFNGALDIIRKRK
jgi:FkbM family methyltransferase